MRPPYRVDAEQLEQLVGQQAVQKVVLKAPGQGSWIEERGHWLPVVGIWLFGTVDGFVREGRSGLGKLGSFALWTLLFGGIIGLIEFVKRRTARRVWWAQKRRIKHSRLVWKRLGPPREEGHEFSVHFGTHWYSERSESHPLTNAGGEAAFLYWDGRTRGSVASSDLLTVPMLVEKLKVPSAQARSLIDDRDLVRFALAGGPSMLQAVVEDRGRPAAVRAQALEALCDTNEWGAAQELASEHEDDEEFRTAAHETIAAIEAWVLLP